MTAILLLSCQDRAGLVARIAQFIFERGGNILDLDEHVDVEDKFFFVRVSWNMDKFSIPADELHDAFAPLAKEFNAEWKIQCVEKKLKAAIFVSRNAHCLQEILWKHSLGELSMDIPVIISNHPDLQPLAEQYKIPYYVFPVTEADKIEQEKKELELLKKHDVDTIVLARYMQILSKQFIEAFPQQIINIHHSFLPAFTGGNPYKQAYESGVKIIGATCHYVSEELDAGPIIEQDIIRISHKDSMKDLIRKGRDLERLVLVRALYYHLEHRILVHGKKTIVFD